MSTEAHANAKEHGEQLEAERAILNDSACDCSRELKAAEAQRDALRTALEEIAKLDRGSWDEAPDIAKAALAGSPASGGIAWEDTVTERVRAEKLAAERSARDYHPHDLNPDGPQG